MMARAARLLTAGTLASLAPSAAQAQGLTLAPFTAADHGLEAAPRLVGIAATAWLGPVGLRAGGAMDVPSSPIAPLLGHPPAEATEAWTAEGDLVLSGARAGLTIGAIRPTVFAGFGLHGRRRWDGSAVNVPAWSYGGGLGVPLFDRLTVDVEARYRMPHESDARLVPADAGAGWEWRAGLSLHLGDLGDGDRGSGAAARGRRTDGMPTTIRLGGGGADASGGVDTGARPEARSASSAAVARRVIDLGDDYLGTPYEWGGESPRTGFDCSGFVQFVFARNGVRLPRVSRDQALAGRPVTPEVSALLPGDLMFYAGSDGIVNHVAIYAGSNRILHSSSSGRGVKYDDLGTRRGRYYATRMVAVRRVIPDGGAFLLP